MANDSWYWAAGEWQSPKHPNAAPPESYEIRFYIEASVARLMRLEDRARQGNVAARAWLERLAEYFVDAPVARRRYVRWVRGSTKAQIAREESVGRQVVGMEIAQARRRICRPRQRLRLRTAVADWMRQSELRPRGVVKRWHFDVRSRHWRRSRRP